MYIIYTPLFSDCCRRK